MQGSSLNGGRADQSALDSADLAHAHLAAIVDSSDDAIISKSLDGMIMSWNKGAERVFGFSPAEAIGKHITMVIPPDRLDEEPRILDRLKRGERVDHFETVRRRRDGSLIDVSLTISPIKDGSGRVVGASKIARDITDRKRIERELKRYHEHLEQLVDERSGELAITHSRLRTSERLAAIGTLSAGLGHDIGNVMMPLTAHIKALETKFGANAESAREHFDTIHRSVAYLQSLANGLRLLAVDSESGGNGASAVVNLDEWWQETEPLLKTALTKRFQLESDIPADLPPVAIAQHGLTQAVFNLVQNASQAMSIMPHAASGLRGWVRISARLEPDRKNIRLSVADNGPGMTDEVKSHCLEPFFTTKTRTISTGLGLAVVHGIVQNARGTLHIDSMTGQGSTFTIVVPVAERAKANAGGKKLVAVVELDDRRLQAVLTHELSLLNFEVRKNLSEAEDECQLLVFDSNSERRAAALEYVRRNEHARALFVGGSNGLPTSTRIVEVGPKFKLEAIRQALRNIAATASTMPR